MQVSESTRKIRSVPGVPAAADGREWYSFMARDFADRLQGLTGPRRVLAWGGLIAACLAATGCLGPMAVGQTRTRYNEVYRSTNDEQILLNIVRLRYADSPVFIDLPNITSQFEVTGRGGYSYGNNGEFGLANLGVGELFVRDAPTLSYHPRSGQEIAKALMTPLSAELLSIVNAGANLEQFLLMAVNEINNLPNGGRSISMMPIAPDDNSEFKAGVQLLAGLEQSGAIELTIRKLEDTEGSDAIPLARVRGTDLVSAAKENYVFRLQGADQVIVRKQERTLVMQVRDDAVGSPELLELARAFRVKPGLKSYRIKSEMTGDMASQDHGPESLEAGDTIYLNMRSILQMAIFLSKGVCIPPEHVISGIAPMTPAGDGQLFDWSHLTQGLFCVQAQKRRPRESEVAVKYRGYWFYIASDDVNSRAAMAIFEILFAVQESEGKPLGPLLTLPLGG